MAVKLRALRPLPAPRPAGPTRPFAEIRADDRAASIADGDLVLGVRRGEPWAEDALARRYVRPLARLASYLLRSPHDVDDLVQDTFLYAFGHVRELRDPAAFRPWLQRIAVGKARNVIRRRRIARALGLDRGAEDGALEALASPALGPDERAELALIDDVLAALPADGQLAWVLRHVEGLSNAEVASALGCSLATAKRRIAEASRRVRDAIGLEVDDG